MARRGEDNKIGRWGDAEITKTLFVTVSPTRRVAVSVE